MVFHRVLSIGRPNGLGLSRKPREDITANLKYSPARIGGCRPLLDTDAVDFSVFDEPKHFHKFRDERNEKLDFIATRHENNDSYFIPGDILLIMHLLVGCDEHIELT
jgi:hypothetical protein